MTGLYRVATRAPMYSAARTLARPPHTVRRSRRLPLSRSKGATPTGAAICLRFSVPTADTQAVSATPAAPHRGHCATDRPSPSTRHSVAESVEGPRRGRPAHAEARRGIDAYLELYNRERPHQSLGYRTPARVFASGRPLGCLPDQASALSSREAVTDFTAGVSLNLAPSLS